MNTLFFKGQSRDKRLRDMPLKYNVDLSYILYINWERVMSSNFVFYSFQSAVVFAVCRKSHS